MTARSGTHAQAVSALEAYELWAETYAPEPHNPLMAVEQRTMLELLPDVRDRRVLDLACGTGRYSRLLAAAGASVVALDLSPAMLRRVSTGLRLRIRASMERLPLADARFDVVISGLALGHTGDLDRWMHEAARVLVPGGTLLYSDFHPAAAARGLRRTFTDGSKRVHDVAHGRHAVADQRAAAGAAGLTIEHVLELRAGIEFVEPFDGADAFYRREHGTPLVLVVRARKPTVRRHRSRTEGGAAMRRPRSRTEGGAAMRRPRSRTEGGAAVRQPRSRTEISAAVRRPRSRTEISAAVRRPRSRTEISAAVRRPRSRTEISAAVWRPRSRPTSSAAGRREPVPGGSGRDIPVADGPPRKISAGIIGRVHVSAATSQP